MYSRKIRKKIKFGFLNSIDLLTGVLARILFAVFHCYGFARIELARINFPGKKYFFYPLIVKNFIALFIFEVPRHITKD